ncbi:MAG: hypothetical protein JOZ40_03605 [Methylobacteriaceae bacterium]|nr:hypothetical protein [Methylobacteriaceae bacterium]
MVNWLSKIALVGLTAVGAVALSGTPGSATSHRAYCWVAGNCGPDMGLQGYYAGGPPPAAYVAPARVRPAPGPAATSGIQPESGLTGVHGPGW